MATSGLLLVPAALEASNGRPLNVPQCRPGLLQGAAQAVSAIAGFEAVMTIHTMTGTS